MFKKACRGLRGSLKLHFLARILGQMQILEQTLEIIVSQGYLGVDSVQSYQYKLGNSSFCYCLWTLKPVYSF